MAWVITFALAALVAAAVYAALRYRDRDRPASYASDARLAAGVVFAGFAVLGSLNVLAYIGV